MNMWTFGRKIAAGFAISTMLLVVIGVVAYRGLNVLADTASRVKHTHEVIDDIFGVRSDVKDAETGQRGFIITGDDAFLTPYNQATGSLAERIRALRERADNPAQQKRLDEVAPVIAAKMQELRETIDLRKASGFEPTQKVVLAGEGKRAMEEIRRILGDMEATERRLLEQRAVEAQEAAVGARRTILGGTALCFLFVVVAGAWLTRSLNDQIGVAVHHVQSSSAELQTAANQQASGAKEQSTSMNEISTTISELLATSRQIAESAQRVAQIAQETAGAARLGDDTVQTSQESVNGVKRQVDVIVTHMLDLGRKSQQIGGVLDIINELADQTNIVAINASIEAAGANETGRRFGVVADEIRKLADRVGGSTKEIRTLIDEIRTAVNTTVMATESGMKAADTGMREFTNVATSFRRIVDLVGTTTEAAREIELSTKQQATAVEQVNVAVSGAARATKETEASSRQTLQTASELATLSGQLTRLVRSNAGAHADGRSV